MGRLTRRWTRGQRLGVLPGLGLRGQLRELTGGARKRPGTRGLHGLRTCGGFVVSLPFVVGGGLYDD